MVSEGVSISATMLPSKPTTDSAPGDDLRHVDHHAGRVDAVLARICAIASDEPTRNELNDARDIAIWKRGVTL